MRSLALCALLALPSPAQRTQDVPQVEDPVVAQHRLQDPVWIELQFAKHDSDGDRELTRAEFAERAEGLFEKIDGDGNGRLTELELLAFREWKRETPENLTPVPSHADLAYGPFKRNKLDLWLAPSDKPTPLVVFIHGGGFRTGDKSIVYGGESFRLRHCYRNGISFAAINYRFTNTATLDEVLRDTARAVQLLRHRAKEFNLDPARIAVYGISAGGGAALWLGAHDDLADPESDDPILRESSRISAVGHINAQASYDFARWAEVFQLPAAFVRMGAGGFLQYYGVDSVDELDSPTALALRHEVDMPALLDEGDAPVFLENLLSSDPPSDMSALLHHPRHATWLKERCDKARLPAVLVLKETPIEERPKLLDFFAEQFGKPASKKD